MARNIEITSMTLSKDGRYFAEGTIDDRPFSATTIIYKEEPIFKVLEDGQRTKLEGSQFSRGDRGAIARACKEHRLESFAAEALDLMAKGVKELKALCKENGVSGYSKMNKEEMVAALS